MYFLCFLSIAKYKGKTGTGHVRLAIVTLRADLIDE